MFIKLGELIELTPADVQTQESVLSVLSDQEITEKFQKFAGELKRIAPKANDFLYFSAVMMHAAEASTVNPDGTPKKLSDGTIVKASWNKEGGTWKWESNDPSLKPYKNSNGDIFPEEELIKAHKKWIGKPLCVDHKSSSVDAIRGVILDTYYDRSLKRVVALCALDKITYPDLAKKVAAGYATCVSMGTAVGRAICSDCGQVARSEADFCNHMRTKSCYGEINVDLNPIELSIVVNGADPKAKIRTILAAANNLNKYIERKESEFVSLADNDENVSKLEDLELEVQKIADQISEIKNSLESEESSTAPYGMTGDKEMSETILPNEGFNLDFPEKVIASNVSKALTDLKDVVESKLNNMEQHIKVLSYKIKEEIMSDTKEKMDKKAYFQGGGGVNEPTPGQVKYEKDPLAEKARFEDKQMVGQNNLDTGPVDGMHPGSAGVSDLERKKMLARAEAEERSLRRAAALEKAKETVMKGKQAYFQGGGGVNEPTPGKPKYEKDPLAEKARKEDKTMVGQKPFPEVGDVDGLHPSPESADEKDELKRKQMLSRATPLKARFVKAANIDGSEDKDNSAWQVFVDDKLALSATVKEISGGNTEVLYDTIATKEFGSKILAKVKEVGLAKAASLYKKSQAVSGMGAQPAAPAEAGGAAPVPPSVGDEAAAMPAPEMPEMPQMEAPAEEPEATDKSGDVKETVLDLVSKLKEDISDLDEAVKSLVGEQAEMGDMANLGATASDELASLHQMRQDLNQGLIDGLSKSVDELSEHTKELELIASMLDDETLDLNEEYANFVVQDAISDAKSALADARNLKKAFVKYARGTEALLLKQAQMADAADMADVEDTKEADDCDMVEDEVAEKDMNDVKLEIEVPDADISKMVMEKAKLASLDSKEARAAARAKLAQKSVEMSQVLDEAHPKGGTQTELDVKPSDELGKVEDLKEQHDKSVEVAQAPVKVRKDAERIQKLVSEGKLDPARVDELVAHGVDADAVKYWKQYFAEADKESSQFATELIKEHAKAELDEQMKVYRVKIARAYETAYDMVSKGLLANDRSAISAQVDDIMKWNDEAFDSFKRVIAAKAAMTKKAGIPLVGQLGSEDPFAAAVEKEDLRSQLEKAFSSKKY